MSYGITCFGGLRRLLGLLGGLERIGGLEMLGGLEVLAVSGADSPQSAATQMQSDLGHSNFVMDSPLQARYNLKLRQNVNQFGVYQNLKLRSDDGRIQTNSECIKQLRETQIL